MAEFYTVNVNGAFRDINLDLVRWIDRSSSVEGPITLHFGPNDEIGLAGGEARRFLNEWDNRWRKAAGTKAA
jgi:hypothetical protein